MTMFKGFANQLTGVLPFLAIGGVALGVGILGTRMVMSSSSAPPTPMVSEAPDIKPDIKTVTALGRLEPKGELISVSAPSSNDGSRLETLLVKEGDAVKRGDIIAVLNSQARLAAALQQAEEQVGVAGAKLAQVKSGAKTGEIQAQRSEIARLNAERTGDYNTQTAVIARLEADLDGILNTQKATRQRLQADYDNAKLEADRHQTLYESGAISASLRDSKRLMAQTAYRRGEEAASEAERARNTLAQQIKEAKAALDRSQNARSEQVDAADSTLNRIAEVRPVDIQTAEAEVRQAEASRTKAAADLEQAYVRSPQDGVILKIHSRPGEKIAPEGIVDLGQTVKMIAIVEVYESDRQRIQLGQSAKVTSDAIGSELNGTVQEIGQKVQRQTLTNTDPTTNTDARVIEIRITLDSPSSKKAAQFTNSQITAKVQTKP
jgi:HlyD family secretion protein